MTTRTINGLRLTSLGAGRWQTDDGVYRVERDDEFVTVCDGPHPMHLPRPQWTTRWDERTGREVYVKGYQCPGNEEHYYTRWGVWDEPGNDFAFRGSPGEFETFQEAAEWLARQLKNATVQYLKHQEEL